MLPRSPDRVPRKRRDHRVTLQGHVVTADQRRKESGGYKHFPCVCFVFNVCGLQMPGKQLWLSLKTTPPVPPCQVSLETRRASRF